MFPRGVLYRIKESYDITRAQHSDIGDTRVIEKTGGGGEGEGRGQRIDVYRGCAEA